MEWWSIGVMSQTEKHALHAQSLVWNLIPALHYSIIPTPRVFTARTVAAGRDRGGTRTH
jgi:hypothetical protein